MRQFNVIVWDFNKKEFTSYDVIPYLIRCYAESKNRPKTLDGIKEFIRLQSMSQWWSRCEYEIILSDWPSQEKEEKIDVHYQVMMNIDIIAEIVMKEIITNKINGN